MRTKQSKSKRGRTKKEENELLPLNGQCLYRCPKSWEYIHIDVVSLFYNVYVLSHRNFNDELLNEYYIVKNYSDLHIPSK